MEKKGNQEVMDRKVNQDRKEHKDHKEQKVNQD